MPNHVLHKIELTGESINIESFFNAVESDASGFDFDKIIPVPMNLNRTISSSDLELACFYALTNKLTELEYKKEYDKFKPIFGDLLNINTFIFGKLDKLKIFLPWHKLIKRTQKRISETSEQDLIMFKKYGDDCLENFINHGVTTYTQWCSKHWGVECNAYDVTVKRDDKTLLFYTANKSPVHVLSEAIEKFKLSGSIKALDELHNFWYITTFQDGEILSKSVNDSADEIALCKELFYYDPTTGLSLEESCIS